MRRLNSRLISIIAGFIFLIFILSRLQRLTSSDYRNTVNAKLSNNEPIKFTDNKPASCSNDLFASSNTPLSLSIVMSTDFNSLSMLEHSVSNVIGYTEPTLLTEIIITSSSELSAGQLDHMKARFSDRSSLITIRKGLDLQSKLTNKLSVGHAYTKGSVLVFIDDTVLVSEGYLAPLLQAVTLHPWGVAAASTNFLSPNDFKTSAFHAEYKWIFNWHLNYAELFQMDFAELSSRSETEKFPSAVFDSAMFALQKSYVTKLGSIRPGLRYINDIDLSFTSWLCGDGVYISPCSRIGQTELSKTLVSPSSVVIAEMYLKSDKYRHAFQSVNKEAIPVTVEERRQIERNTASMSQCSHSFDQYMDTVVAGDVYTPSNDVRAFGEFVVSSGSVFTRSPAMVFLLTKQPVRYATRVSTIEYLKSGQLRTGSNCLVLSDTGYIVSEVCNYQKQIFKWDWTRLKQFKVTVNGEDRCISHSTDPYPEQNQRQVLMYTICAKDLSEDSARFQVWNSFIWL